MRDDGATDETLAAPATGPKLARGTTRGSDPTVSADLVRQVTRASSPSLSQPAVESVPVVLPVVERSNYQIISELARGGMGRILEARDLRLDRPIAIKEVLDDDEGARARFDREVRITAGLQHPAIVHVTEAGQWPDGQPFFAMKLIRGKPLDVRIAEAASLTDRLTLLPAVIAVTDALAYAHTQAVIHRDLKPANVLVGDFGETVVIDWGIAKDLSDTEEMVSLRPEVRAVPAGAAETVAGSVMGTPSYMPPEQANGDRVDARADVYALGAMLYQVLAGVPPFIGRTTAEVLAKVLESAPEPLASIVPDAPSDLITIVEKAMARAPADRFPTANEMVAELKRFQRGMLVKSHDYTTWQLTKRWFARNRGAVLVGAIACVALVVFGGLGLWRIVVERRNTEIEAIEARTQADTRTIAEAKEVLATDPTEALAILKRLSPDTLQLRAARMIASEAAAAGIAHVMTAPGSIQGLAFSPDERSLASYEHRSNPDDPGDTVRIWDLTTWTSRPIGGAPDLIAIGFTGDAVHGIDRGGRIWEWPATALTPVAPRLVRSIGGRWQLAQWSPDGTRVVVFSHMREGHAAEELVRVVDLESDDRLVGPYTQPTWTADGRAILVHDRKANAVLRFDLASGELTTLFENAAFPSFASDGKHTWIARDTKSFGPGTQDYLRHLERNMRFRIGHKLTQLVTLPGGRVVGSTLDQRGVPMAETLRGTTKGQLVLFDPELMSSGDHSLVVSDGWPGSVTRLFGHTAAVDELVVSRGGMIASGDRRGTIRVWTLPTVARDHGDNHTTASFAALRDGRDLIIARRSPRLEVRDLLSGTTRVLAVTEVAAGITREMTNQVDRSSPVGERSIREISIGPDDEVIEMAVSADGHHVATVDSAEHVVVWDLAAGRGKLLADRVKHVAINRDGTRITTSREIAGTRRSVEEWDVATGKPTRLGEMVPTIMLYGPGDRLAIATDLATAFVFHDRKAIEYDLTQGMNYRALAFSPDGRHLFLGADNWVIAAVDLSTGAIRQFHGHQGTVVTLLVDRDSKRLFSAAADHTVRVWDIASGTATVLRGHTGLVTSIVEGEDHTLLTASLDGTARLWDLESLQSRPLRGHEDRVLVAGHLRGGQRIIVTDLAHQVAEYADNLPRDEALLRSWLDAATNAE